MLYVIWKAGQRGHGVIPEGLLPSYRRAYPGLQVEKVLGEMSLTLARLIYDAWSGAGQPLEETLKELEQYLHGGKQSQAEAPAPTAEPEPPAPAPKKGGRKG